MGRHYLGSGGPVVPRVPVIPITVEDVLIHRVALLRVELTGELLRQPVQGFFHGNAYSRPRVLLLAPVQDDLAAFQNCEQRPPRLLGV
jgi:hypothetical protein